MDRHPAHTSNATNEFFDNNEHRLEVKYLPAYSPELNPVEYVNHFAKTTGPRKQLPLNKFHLSEIVHEVLGSLKGAFKQVKSYFKHEELEYINLAY